MQIGQYALLAVSVVIALLPPKYDPAVRLKEWAYGRLMKKRKKESEHDAR